MKRIAVLVFVIALPLQVFAYRYNFLNNPEVLDFTVGMLTGEGIAEDNLAVWRGLVDTFNRRVTFYHSTASGWVTTVDPSLVAIHSPYGDYYANCRMSLFTLVHDLVGVDKYLRAPQTAGHIGRELDSLTNYLELSDREMLAYKSLFNPIDIPVMNLDESIFTNVLQLYKTWWSKEGLRFPQNPNLEIMQAVVIVPEGKHAFDDHVGLIVKSGGKIYLLEKISPAEPFCISEFADYEEMGNHIWETFRKWSNAGIMILANDRAVWTHIND